MKERILFFVTGTAPEPEETAAIMKLLEPQVVPAVGNEGEEGYEPERTITPNVEVVSVEKLDLTKPADVSHVTAVHGAVPPLYADAFTAAVKAAPAEAWSGPAKKTRK